MTSVELLAVVPDPGLWLDADPTTILARLFQRHGVPVRGRRLVALDEDAAEHALRQAVEGGGLVICLGAGGGAERARQALARLTGSRLVLSEGVLEAVAASYAQRGHAMPRRAEALALIPQGATLLAPPGGGEPGLLAEVGGTLVAVLPGDAGVASTLVEAQLLPRLLHRAVEPVSRLHTLKLVGLDGAEVETRLAGALRGQADTGARVVDVDGEVWVRLELRGPTVAAAERRFAELAPVLRAAFGAAWYGQDEDSLPVVVGRLLKTRRLTLAVAESCTGGLIGHRLTDVAGSSAYFERSLVVYSNPAKQTLLGVPAALLARFGAVSAECAEAMARGVRAQAETDLGLSVTGIAGPEGGTPTKPVGTVFIGLADLRSVTVERHRFDRDREGNKALAALWGLELVRRYCLEPTRPVAAR
ncbi:MAG TPA: nicotinamide-nucleotide amidohydrolase family protein [Methylomirabilota bacterium]|nr:nicotinamide-nucleotide amidohydrolase family protein [Methylomirabilota bacterium]